jgi:hypothetical protein
MYCSVLRHSHDKDLFTVGGKVYRGKYLQISAVKPNGIYYWWWQLSIHHSAQGI